MTATAVATFVLAIATVFLAVKTRDLSRLARLELDELRIQHRDAAAARECDARRGRAMNLLTVLIRCHDALRSFERDVLGEGGLDSGLVGSVVDVGGLKWGRFAGDSDAIRPELTTWLYVCEFVGDNLRETIADRFNVLAAAVAARDLSLTLDRAKSLAASLDQVRELVDRELGLTPSRRPL